MTSNDKEQNPFYRSLREKVSRPNCLCSVRLCSGIWSFPNLAIATLFFFLPARRQSTTAQDQCQCSNRALIGCNDLKWHFYYLPAKSHFSRVTSVHSSILPDSLCSLSHTQHINSKITTVPIVEQKMWCEEERKCGLAQLTSITFIRIQSEAKLLPFNTVVKSMLYFVLLLQSEVNMRCWFRNLCLTQVKVWN